MQTYDFLMLAVLAGLTWYGYMKGMAWQIAYVASFVASYFVSMNFADRIAPLFGSSAPFNKFAAMLAMYIASSFGIWSVFRLVRGMIDSVKMEGFDHQMGALLGFGRGVLWCVGITFFAVTLLPGAQKEQIIGSRSGHYISVLLSKTKSIAPPEVAQVINPYIEKVERGLSGQGGDSGNSPPAGPAPQRLRKHPLPAGPTASRCPPFRNRYNRQLNSNSSGRKRRRNSPPIRGPKAAPRNRLPPNPRAGRGSRAVSPKLPSVSHTTVREANPSFGETGLHWAEKRA